MPLPDLQPPVPDGSSPPVPQSVADDAVAGGSPPVTAVPAAPAQVSPSAMPTVRANFNVTYPQGMVPNIMPGQGGAGEETARGPRSGEEWLNELAARARPGAFKFLVRRIRPATHDNYRLNLSQIGEMDPMPFEAAKEAIRDWYGGGDYQILVRNLEGNVVNTVPVSIDLVMHPPKIPQNAQRMVGPNEANSGNYGGVPGMQGAQLGQPESPEFAEMRRLRMEEQRELQQEQTRRAQLRSLKAEREFLRESRSEEEADMQAANALREQMNMMMQSMMQGFEKLATAMTANKDDKTLPLLLESMKESREQQRLADERLREQTRLAEERDRLSREETTKLMLSVLGSRQNTGESEMVKAVLAANQQATQAVVEASKKESGQVTRMVEMLVTNKLQSNETNVRQMLDLMDRGRQQATEQMQMMLELRGAQEDVINPDNGFWNNFGNMFLSGLNKLFTGLGSGVAGKLGGAGQAMLPPPQMVMPQQSPPVMYPAEGQVLQQPEYQPVQQMPPQPVQQIQQVPPPVQQVQQVQPPQQVQQAQPDNIVSLLYDGVLQDVRPAQVQAQQAPSASSSQIQAVAVSPDLAEHVTEAMRLAISDITAGRSEQDWADYAGGKWGNFLQALVAASDDASRLRLIQSQCAPAVYQQFHQLMVANPVGMRNFVNSMHAMLSEFQRELRSA